MGDPGAVPKLRIAVIGSFRVTGAAGEDLTPRGRKARALLAILAMSHGRHRSRAALQDKLWSDRSPEQGAASLRQTLSEIRRALGPGCRDCLVSDMRGVGLDQDGVTVDLDRADLAELARRVETPRLLEDIDLADDEFEQWLRNQRTAFEQRIAAARSAAGGEPARADPRTGEARRGAAPGLRPWVRLLPPLTVSSEVGLFLSRMIGDRITRGLADQWGVDVGDGQAGPQGVLVRVEALALGPGAAVNIVLQAPDGQTQLWSASESFGADMRTAVDAPRLQTLINRAIDAAGYVLYRLSPSLDRGNAYVLAFGAVQRMFKVDLAEVDRADHMLGHAWQLDPNPAYLAWRAYARTFYVGEHMQSDRRRAVEESEELAKRAIEAAPDNATILALASYVFSFAFRNFAVGHELGEQSIRANPGHPLGHAFLGRTKSYLGEHEAGYLETCVGRELAGQAPYRYKLYFLCGVTALLSGRFNEAVRAAEMACTMAPGYRAPQRYLVPLYLRLGERDKARSAYERLRRIEPTFSLDMMRETTYPSTAVREAGLLQFSDRDL